ncbi:MAG: universal stress protein [Methanocellales archaeon]|nr:universal stress protein [Methanocellales archaeon]MDD4898604.1 universal stress protein [Methanocellales archaeon]MDD5446957.1 universal stress protein [Methanocellales archaeon]
MKKILIAYDGSEDSKRALDWAVELAKCTESSITILTVVPSATRMFAFDDLLVPGTFKTKALNMVQEAGKRIKGISVTSIIREGDIADEILKASEDLGCDLVVMGRRGLGKIDRFLLGSVAEKVVKHSSKTVLMVR